MQILVALSGGVDSAVAALLLQKAGHTVSAVYMRTWMDEESTSLFAQCPWEEDRDSARAVAEFLNIPFRVINMIDAYQERVVQYLVESYRSGITPNPDTMCNREIKFGVLIDYAKKEGFEALATGHYCQRRENADGCVDLLEGIDPLKDQSYFLSRIHQDALQFARFPIGSLKKEAVRRMAEEAHLPNAKRKDSQGICFLGKVSIQDFLQQYIPNTPGDIVNLDGKVLGQHNGLHRYTLGQRKGIGVPSNTDYKNYVVIRKDIKNNQLIVAFDEMTTEGLYRSHACIKELHWINKPILEKTFLLARPRYRDPAESALFEPNKNSPCSATLTFEKPQRALAPGQIMAIYSHNILLGSGILE